MTVERVCAHAERRGGKCPDCGYCEHELVLNGACFYCGETNLSIASPLVPVANLTRRRNVEEEES